jgi:hypothetical protein
VEGKIDPGLLMVLGDRFHEFFVRLGEVVK